MYKILANSGKKLYGVKTYMVETISDMNAIPLLSTVAPGSTVIVTKTSEKYILSRDRKWVLLKKSEQSGGDEPSGDEIVYEGGDLEAGDDQAAELDYEGGEL